MTVAANDPGLEDTLGDVNRWLTEPHEVAGIAATTTALELYRYLNERYPRRINPGALWGSARAAKN